MSRRSWNVAWLVVLLAIVGVVVIRYARSFGPLGIIVPIILVAVVVAVMRGAGPTWLYRSRSAAPPPVPRNVTPPEPMLSTRATIGPRPAQTPVVVIDTAARSGATREAGETLEAKLATLDRLREEGRLTSAEFEAKRAQLIADF